MCIVLFSTWQIHLVKAQINGQSPRQYEDQISKIQARVFLLIKFAYNKLLLQISIKGAMSITVTV